MKKSAILIIFITISVSAFGMTKFVINNGHFSPIVNIQYDENRSLIFSAEEKGAISVWNRSDETLRNHFQITS